VRGEGHRTGDRHQQKDDQKLLKDEELDAPVGRQVLERPEHETDSRELGIVAEGMTSRRRDDDGDKERQRQEDDRRDDDRQQDGAISRDLQQLLGEKGAETDHARTAAACA
jgi:hypothetical protein